MTSAGCDSHCHSQRREHDPGDRPRRWRAVGLRDRGRPPVSTALESRLPIDRHRGCLRQTRKRSGGPIARVGWCPARSCFVTTKLATDDQGYQSSQDALKASLERLGLDYVGPLSHPLARRRTQASYVNSWGGLMKRRGGRRHQIHRRGQLPRRTTCRTSSTLSYFTPAINQIELAPPA